MGDLDIQFKSFFSLKKGMIKMIEGYKAFDNDFKCLGKQYEPNKTFVENGNIELCERGMHFCENPLDIFRYKNIICGSLEELVRFAKVQAIDKIISDGDKICTNVLKIKDEIDYFELIHDIFKMNKKRNYYRGYYYTGYYHQMIGNQIYCGLLFNYSKDQNNDINLCCQDSTIINGISNRNNQLIDSFFNNTINYANNVTFDIIDSIGNNILIFGQNNTICLNHCKGNIVFVLGEHNNIYINDTFCTKIIVGKNNYIRVSKNNEIMSSLNIDMINYEELLRLSISDCDYSLRGTIKRRYDTYGKFFKK